MIGLIQTEIFNTIGQGGIRTPGILQYAGFQDRCLQPLDHSSSFLFPIPLEKMKENKNLFSGKEGLEPPAFGFGDQRSTN